MINRIILIGNGFDLAHQMPTSYSDFINSYWSEKCELYNNYDYFFYECDEFSMNSNYKNKYDDTIRNFLDLHNVSIKNGLNFTAKNNFFIQISKGLQQQGWVDIEALYYDQLKYLSVSNEKDEANSIDVLNKEFTDITKLLEKYLIDVQSHHKINSLIKNRITEIINQPINKKDLSQQAVIELIDNLWQLLQSHIVQYNGIFNAGHTLTSTNRNIIKDFVSSNPHSRSKEDFSSYILENFSRIFFSEIPHTEFINFNYTSTESFYITSNTQTCHIHGELMSKENPIIFGYGDELDDYYKDIEKLNDNRYLEHVKSINYAKTDNYKRILTQINDGLFQVYILGHSCGNSDRTLLNTIFEHENCASIKFFYHQKNESEDNFLDIYKNISRNFNNKTKLRDRVVNKKYSEPLIPFELQLLIK